MTMTLPTLLALVGAALMAIAILAPHRLPPPSAYLSAPPEPGQISALPGAGIAEPSWPQLVDPVATYCNADARRALVDALALLETPWSLAILRQALADETDSAVAAAIASALASSSQSLVT
jgi:hypothetical protein